MSDKGELYRIRVLTTTYLERYDLDAGSWVDDKTCGIHHIISGEVFEDQETNIVKLELQRGIDRLMEYWKKEWKIPP
jgi:hypothetical protein